MSGFKELILIEKEDVCDTIKSFYFKAKNGGSLEKYKGGQYLPIRVTKEDGSEIFRVYSLSNYPNGEIYRISVKKLESGEMSSYLHDKLNVGDTILCKEPMGDFIIKERINDPIVLISGGIGITPLLSMLYCEQGKRKDITFIQAVQNSRMHPFKEDIQNICQLNGYKNFTFYSNPLESDVRDKNYDFTGFISKEWLEKSVNLNSSFYFCGPPIFMESLEKNLLELGVSKDKINYEYFSYKN